jgi:hypothetical protein
MRVGPPVSSGGGLAGRAGGIDRLPAWFRSWWTDHGKAAEEWRSYLSGQYVCLRSVRPDTVTLIGSMA